MQELKFNGEAMKAVRERRGMTRANVSGILGSNGTATYFERGERIPTLPTINKIAEALGCNPMDLLTVVDVEEAA